MSNTPSLDKTILVTGAGGFIGSHLVEHLLAEGWRVRAMVRYSSHAGTGFLTPVREALAQTHDETSAPELGPNAVKVGPLELIWSDVTDPDLARQAVRGTWGVCHLAALIGIPYSYVAPGAYVQTNIIGTMNLLEAARHLGTEAFIQTSTSEVYGSALYTPIDLDHPLQAQSPYSATKIGADKLAESYARSFGLKSLVLRPFNTFGPRQSMRAVIPTIIHQALSGDTVKLGHVAAIRDFTYVNDTCRAYGLALKTGFTPGACVHLGTGFGVTIAEVVHTVGRVLGRELHIQTRAERVRPEASEVDTLLSDPSVAQEVLGWTPQLSFEQGIAHTIDWLREHRPTDGDRYHV